jgi:hypothetical protein
MKLLKTGQKVIVNTGGEDCPALIITPQARNIHGEPMPHRLTGSDGDAYFCKFENNTAQYIPAKYIKTV